MKSFAFLIILAVSLNSCLNTQRDVVRCEKYSRMILGEWISARDSSVTIKILSDTIIHEYREDDKYNFVNRINIVNELKDCNDDEISRVPPSKLRILEFEDNDDLGNSNGVEYTRIHHILSIDSEDMEWGSGNHLIWWKRKKSNIQDSNFIQDSGTAIEMD